MACVEWQNEKAKNKRTKIVESRRKGIFFTFYLKIVGVYDNGNFYKENYVTAKNLGK